MKVAMDRAGRIVVPKALRDALVATTDEPLPPLSSEDVRAALEAQRR